MAIDIELTKIVENVDDIKIPPDVRFHLAAVAEKITEILGNYPLMEVIAIIKMVEYNIYKN